jgi:hypothetical protein
MVKAKITDLVEIKKNETVFCWARLRILRRKARSGLNLPLKGKFFVEKK